jgi:drug/metabolite transporter (DMT)-like permease
VTDPPARHDLLGGASAAVSAVLFGTIIIWGRFVLERGVPVETMLSIRFAIGALALLLALLLTRRPVLAARGERLRLVLLALFGYAIEASLFFTATQHGTVAAVTLLFFTYPVFVTVWAWGLGGDLPARLTLFALLCAVAGAAIVVGTGTGLAIDGVGVLLAFVTAVTYSAYLTGVDLLVDRTNALTSAMWVSAGASIGLFVYANAVGHWDLPDGAAEWWPLVGMGLSSAGAFFFLMEALARIGAVRTSIVSAMEPLAAAVLGFWFLDESVTFGVAAGGLLILAGAVMASRRSPSAAERRASRGSAVRGRWRSSSPHAGRTRGPRRARPRARADDRGPPRAGACAPSDRRRPACRAPRDPIVVRRPSRRRPPD